MPSDFIHIFPNIQKATICKNGTILTLTSKENFDAKTVITFIFLQDQFAVFDFQ